VVLPITWTDEEFAEGTDPDDKTVRDMVIPLTHRQAVARARKFGVPITIRKHLKGPMTRWYACRHWDEETRLCSIYDRRPMICRDFPYGDPCRYGCSCTVAPDVAAKWAAWRVELDDDVPPESVEPSD